jgi:menaquinone-specific isochorismate synthase
LLLTGTPVLVRLIFHAPATAKLAAVKKMPHLRVVTRELPSRVDVLSYANAQNPLVWVRDRRGFVGVGETLRLSASGASRFQELAAMWQEVTANAEIDDRVKLPGSGLISLGSVAFSAESPSQSVLIVPECAIHRHDDRWFVTKTAVVGTAEEEQVLHMQRATPDELIDELPEIASVPHWEGAAIDPVLTGDRAEHYRQAVAELTERIARGEAQKVVLARPVVGEIGAEADLRVPLGRLAERYLDCWTYAVDGLIGASPETLIRLVNRTATALVLAGTAPRHHDDPVADDAERKFLETAPHIEDEHHLAALSVAETLGPLVSNLYMTQDPRVIRLPNVWHRATEVSAHTEAEVSSLKLVEAMHPTAAIAGTPTQTALKIIEEVEHHDRGRYSGAVGWIDASGDGEWAIALRCAQVSANDSHRSRTLTAWAGGGIVAGSDPQTELDETVSKLTPIVEAFQ